MTAYVYKVVFAERRDFSQDELDYLYSNNLMVDTDYGTMEIMSNMVKEECINSENNEGAEILIKVLGKETFDMLCTGDVDFILVT